MIRRTLKGIASSGNRTGVRSNRGVQNGLPRARIGFGGFPRCKTIISILFLLTATTRFYNEEIYDSINETSSAKKLRQKPLEALPLSDPDDRDISCVQSLLENEKAVIADSSMKESAASFQILLHPRTKDKYITRKIQSKGVYEADMEDFISLALPLSANSTNVHREVGNEVSAVSNGEKALRPWALDMGANVGFHSLHMAKRGANVISFEPAPDTAALLQCSAKLLRSRATATGDTVTSETQTFIAPTPGSITVVEAGASDTESRAKMLRHPSSPGMTTFGTNATFPLEELESITESSIRLLRPDDVLSALGVPEGRSEYLRLLKVDVEGYELRALKGLDLKRFPFQFLTFELFPEMLRASEAEPADLLSLVRDAGYDCDHDKHFGSTKDEMNAWIDGIKSHVNIFCKLYD